MEKEKKNRFLKLFKKNKKMNLYDDGEDLPILPSSLNEEAKQQHRLSKRAYRRYLNNMVTFSELEEIYNYDSSHVLNNTDDSFYGSEYNNFYSR